MTLDTVWVLGDQLNPEFSALSQASPGTHRVLMIESANLLASKTWHIQRAHLVIAAMRRFAEELRAAGFAVDYRFARTLAEGLHDHRAIHRPEEVLVMEPASWSARERMTRLGCRVVPGNQFLCHYSDFAAWVNRRPNVRMEDFYRWQRQRLGYLMEGTGPRAQPSGGRWNFDADNRRPPPRGHVWPAPLTSPLDDLDRAVIEHISPFCEGESPTGIWATTRAEARRRLDHFIDRVLPGFGPHEDAMTTGPWHLAHSLLSPYLNLGLLTPAEVCDAVQVAFDRGLVPIASAEG